MLSLTILTQNFSYFICIYLKKIVDVVLYDMLQSMLEVITKGGNMIYYIQNKESKNIKIGFSEYPLMRLKALEQSTKTELELLALSEGNRKEEIELHAKFKELSLGGEWFKPGYKLIGHIENTRVRLSELTATSISKELLNEILKSLEDRNNLDDILNEIERQVILITLQKRDWNISQSAKALNMSFRSLRYRIEKLELKAYKA